MDAQKWLRCRGIKNAPLYNFYLLVLVMLWSHDLWCHSCFPPYWIWMFNSYFQLVLHRHNSWLAEHHKAKANFMCAAYLRNGCRYKYNHAWMGEDLNQLPITDKPKSFNNGTPRAILTIGSGGRETTLWPAVKKFFDKKLIVLCVH